MGSPFPVSGRGGVNTRSRIWDSNLGSLGTRVGISVGSLYEFTSLLSVDSSSGGYWIDPAMAGW